MRGLLSARRAVPEQIVTPHEPPLEILPASDYARYALPVDYPPSRRYAPRWGYSHPRIAALDSWFRSNTSQYAQFLLSMRQFAPGLANIPREFDAARLPEPAWLGVAYSPFDSVALYTMIRTRRPKVYLEIGSGITTCFARRAIQDGGLDTKIISIDPHPRAEIDAICDRVERVGLEECDPSIFDQLEANDILFFDGSHRSFMNSDVTVFMLDVLPALKPGVIVHVHDVMLPVDYPPFFKDWYWNEQYILAVYLIGHRYRIDPLLPTWFICNDAAFASDDFALVDIGNRGTWRGGGAMWFSHTSPMR